MKVAVRRSASGSKLIAAFFLTGAVFCGHATGETPTYYVDASIGSDASNGLRPTGQNELDGPWRTLTKAVESLPSGACTVLVAEGTYRESIIIRASGASDRDLLTFRALGRVTVIGTVWIYGDFIMVDGFRFTLPSGSVEPDRDTATICSFARGSVIQNCTIEDAMIEGIGIYKRARGCTVRNNRLRCVCLNGMWVDGSDHLIEGNDISDVRDSVNGSPVRVDANAIFWNGNNHIFRGNFIHDFSWSKQTGHPHIDAFQTWLGTAGCTFEKNHIVMMEEAPFPEISMCAFMLGGGVENLTIRNNLIEAFSGVNTAEPRGPVTRGLKIYNNTWRSSLGFSTWRAPVCAIQLFRVEGAEIYNNITTDFPSFHYGVGEEARGIVLKNNCMFNTDGTRPVLRSWRVDDTDVWMRDAEFVQRWNDYHLRAASPCIDAGKDLSGLVLDDFDGNVRPQGSGFDIGCYEWVPMTTVGLLSPGSQPDVRLLRD
jgi:hypothetical protein